ncbi:hypothetical protein TI04_10475 [Achromatium sp. WMS2]|nr:hypothetical protein TI04_10475 [Achromatium sp. WMS2]
MKIQVSRCYLKNLGFYLLWILIINVNPVILQPAVASAPAPGTEISNSATATYKYYGANLIAESNRVIAIVQPLPLLQLTADRSILTLPGSNIYLAHQLTNIGNVATDCTPVLANLSGDDFNLDNLGLYQDLNHNGTLDSTDTIVPSGASIPVTANSNTQVDLIITGQVPTSASGRSAVITITCSNPELATPVLRNTDTITLSWAPDLTITKTPSTTNNFQVGNQYSYTPYHLSLSSGRLKSSKN